MIKDLDLLNFNNDKFHTKKKIVHLLSLEWPLTAKSVYNRLKRYYNVNISYQAVFKLLKELEKEDVLVCKNLHYMLNVEWLKQIKKSLEVVEKNYVKGKKILIQEPFDKPIKLEFDSFTDLCVATAE
ncbi:MAG: hypothetical protein QXX06_03585, partial [Candidatus Diapherotrites archaeon]